MNKIKSYTLKDIEINGFSVKEGRQQADTQTYFVVLKRKGSLFLWVSLSKDGEIWDEPRRSEVLA
jgi:GTP-dependent phosphoenolpyruvate carboxykinase